MDIGKTAGVTRIGLMSKLQSGVLGILFGFVPFVAISKHPPTISSCLAASVPCLASRTTISGQIMGARQSVGLSGLRVSWF